MEQFQSLSNEQLGQMLPHGEGLCLLDEVVRHSHDEILCKSMSHQRKDNPFRIDGRLPWSVAIEYAAQATAIHLALLDRESAGAEGGKLPVRVIGAVRGMQFCADDLDEYFGELQVHAKIRTAGVRAAVYDVVLRDDSEQILKASMSLLAPSQAA